MLERDKSKPAWRPSSYVAEHLEDRLEPYVGQRISRKARLLFFDLTLFLGLFILLHALLWGGSKDPLDAGSLISGNRGETTKSSPAIGNQAWQQRHTAAQLALFEPHGEWDPIDIQRVCRKTKQIPGLYFGCISNDAIYWDSRNMILLCLRYALQMGGGMVMPRIKYKSELGDLSSYFDLEVFRQRIHEACPELRLVETKQDIPHYANIKSVPSQVDPYSMPGQRNARGLREHEIGNLYNLQASMQRWLEEYSDQQPTEETPVFVNFYTVHWGWPADFDHVGFWANWGKLLIPAPDYRALAAHAYDSIKRVTPHTTILPSENITSPSYLSIVLINDDSQLEQMETILEQPEVKALDTRTIYLSTYDHDADVKRPATSQAIQLAKEMGYDIETRVTLLRPEEGEDIQHTTETGVKVTSTHSGTTRDKQAFEALDNLRFDRSEIIDWMLQLRSTLFVSSLAPEKSSHSYARSLAVSRHIWACPAEVGGLTSHAKHDLARFIVQANVTLSQLTSAWHSGKTIAGSHAITLEKGLSAEQEKEVTRITNHEMDAYFHSATQRDGRSVLVNDSKSGYLYKQIWP